MQPDFFRSYPGAQVAVATIAQVQISVLVVEAASLNGLSPLRGCVFFSCPSSGAATQVGMAAQCWSCDQETQQQWQRQRAAADRSHLSPPRALTQSLVSVSWVTLHLFTPCVYYSRWATWRLDKWVNEGCWHTRLKCMLSVNSQEVARYLNLLMTAYRLVMTNWGK